MELLQKFVEELIEQLPQEDVDCARAFLQHHASDDSRRLHLTTACSGTDNFIDGFTCISNALLGGEGTPWEHIWSCEIDQEKRKWIMLTRPELPALFTTVAALWQKEGINCMKTRPGKGLVTSPILTSWVLGSGFVCKDISSLNGKASGNRTCVGNGTARSGATWKDLMRHVDVHFPKNLFFENVRMLLAVDKAQQLSYADRSPRAIFRIATCRLRFAYSFQGLSINIRISQGPCSCVTRSIAMCVLHLVCFEPACR